MNWSLVDPGVIRPWLICETGSRWLTAVRRFGPEMVPEDLVPKVESASRDEILASLSLAEPSIVLWEARRESLAANCESLARTSAVNPRALQIIACHHLTRREQLCLTPFSVAAMIQHPEELPRLTRMIHLHFARWTQSID
jgi:hypothetical protein